MKTCKRIACAGLPMPLASFGAEAEARGDKGHLELGFWSLFGIWSFRPQRCPVTGRQRLLQAVYDLLIGDELPITNYESPVTNRPNLHPSPAKSNQVQQSPTKSSKVQPSPAKSNQVHYNLLIPVFEVASN